MIGPLSAWWKASRRSGKKPRSRVIASFRFSSAVLHARSHRPRTISDASRFIQAYRKNTIQRSPMAESRARCCTLYTAQRATNRSKPRQSPHILQFANPVGNVVCASRTVRSWAPGQVLPVRTWSPAFGGHTPRKICHMATLPGFAWAAVKGVPSSAQTRPNLEKQVISPPRVTEIPKRGCGSPPWRADSLAWRVRVTASLDPLFYAPSHHKAPTALRLS